MAKVHKALTIVCAIVLSIALFGCEELLLLYQKNEDTAGTTDTVGGADTTGGTGAAVASGGKGTLSVKMTDFPLGEDMVESIFITILRVEVSITETGGWTVIADNTDADPANDLPNDGNFDLMELVGNVATLAQTDLPGGTYTQIRLILNADNEIKFEDDPEHYALKIPSGTQTGIKIKGDIVIVPGATTELLLDFDAQKSVHRRGKADTGGKKDKKDEGETEGTAGAGGGKAEKEDYILRPVIHLKELEVGVSGYWARAYLSEGEDVVRAIQATFDGGYIVVGESAALRDGAVDVWDTNTRIVKLDAIGDVMWELAHKEYGEGTVNETGREVLEMSDGYVVVQTSDSGDLWLLELDDVGGVGWEQSFSGLGSIYAYSIRPASRAGKTGLAVAGSASSISGGPDFWVLELFDDDSSVPPKQYADESRTDYSLGGGTVQSIITTSDGSYVVARAYSSASEIHKLESLTTESWPYVLDSGRVYSVAEILDGDGGFVVAGYIEDTGTTGTVLMLDNTGNLVWQKSYTGVAEIRSVKPAEGGFIAAGATSSSVLGGDADYWIAELDADGGIAWQKTLGPANEMDIWPIVVAPDSSGYVVARSTHAYGTWDYWVLKLNSNGESPPHTAEGFATVEEVFPSIP